MIKKSCKRVISMILCVALFTSCTVASFATTDSMSEVTKTTEAFEVDGKSYILERQITAESVTATVYDEDSNQILSQFTNYIANESCKGFYIENEKISTLATTPEYKLVSTTNGNLEPVKWTLSAVIAYIAVKFPSGKAAAIAELAQQAIDSGCKSFTYKIETWTASDSTYFYQKTIFKLYKKGSTKQFGPSLITKVKTKQK